MLEALRADRRASPETNCISTSIGIAICPNDAIDREALLSHADTALYRAKTDGRNTYRFFEASMGAAVRERRMLEHDLRLAIARNELRLVYQPQSGTQRPGHDRLRGPVALEASRARRDFAGGVHSDRRGERRDPARSATGCCGPPAARPRRGSSR